ncbi:30S ribosomal protein S20 [Alteribacillus iranensis]|uniref:Small ribosomal subunit protein bS20 n=1 Tax=Alteribacillus iranensis TaxID=930128 RepID=A0A1I1ZAG1_9BACI|nr:30S ribosomal protein S20 [Alteribacillus iranensis]SFE28552.1 small subunit ribosomal protein S20 [Alteribacillus iranensis]
MANIKSAKKRVLTNETKRVKQQAFKSAMRSAVKEFYKKADSNDQAGAKELLVLAEKKLDKAAGKNIIHKNSAAREKSRMHERLNEIAQ